MIPSIFPGRCDTLVSWTLCAFYPVCSVATKRDNLQFIPLLCSGRLEDCCMLLMVYNTCCWSNLDWRYVLRWSWTLLRIVVATWRLPGAMSVETLWCVVCCLKIGAIAGENWCLGFLLSTWNCVLERLCSEDSRLLSTFGREDCCVEMWRMCVEPASIFVLRPAWRDRCLRGEEIVQILLYKPAWSHDYKFYAEIWCIGAVRVWSSEDWYISRRWRCDLRERLIYISITLELCIE